MVSELVTVYGSLAVDGDSSGAISPEENGWFPN